MVSQHKLIFHPRACASPSPQICRRHAVCICSSSIFNAMHGTYPFELSLPCYYREFNLRVLWLWWEKKCFCFLISHSLSLYISLPLPVIHPPHFFTDRKVDCFYLVSNRWDILGCSSWLAKYSGSKYYLTCMNPSGAWLVHSFPEHQLLSITWLVFRSAMTNSQNNQAHSWPLLTPPPNRGWWLQLCSLLRLAPFLDPELILLEQCQVVHKYKAKRK